MEDLVTTQTPKIPNEENLDDLSDVDRNNLQKSIDSIVSELAENPNSYDAHVNLIKCLRKLGDKKNISDAREKMHAIYPLSPALWMDWIKDEVQWISTIQDRKHIIELFKRAVDDYEDVDLWLEYCQFSIGNLTSPQSKESVEEIESVFESALIHQGLNVANGAMLWDVFREFQYVLLSQIDPQNKEEFESRLKKIDQLFRRQLTIPLLGMEKTMSEYESFLNGPGAILYPQINVGSPNLVSNECQSAYKLAMDKLNILMPFEEALEDADETESYAAWESYLNWAVRKPEKRAKSTATTTTTTLLPSEVCCLFERAITAHCLYPSLWLRYVDYLESELSSDLQRLLRVLARSVRNCPWSVDLWLRYALVSESMAWDKVSESHSNGSDEEQNFDESPEFKQVEAVYETSLNAGFENPKETMRLWIGFCDYRVRRLNALDRDSKMWEPCLFDLRNVFDRAVEYCLATVGRSSSHSDWTIFQYYAFVEAKHANDLGRARSIWSRLMQVSGHGSDIYYWMAYVQFELHWGDIKHLMKVCSMAINSVSTSQYELLFQSILNAIGQFGLPIDRYRELESRIRARRLILAERFRSSTDKARDSNKDGNQDEDEEMTNAQPKHKSKQHQQMSKSNTKRKQDDSNEPKSAPPKKQKLDTPADSSLSKTNKTSNTSSETQVHGVSVSHDPTKNNVTAFVSNLDFKVTEEQLRRTFEKCGDLVSVRLVRDYAGRSKGFAYIEFKDSASVPKALQLDRHPVDLGPHSESSSTDSQATPSPLRPMFVSKCDPNRSELDGFRYVTGKPEPEKLFVRNLDRSSVTVESLKKLFGQYGTVVDVRLATYRNGTPKGHAYIEFSNANEASRALVATNGLNFGNKPLLVAISNPPPKPGLGSSHNRSDKADSTKMSQSDNKGFAVPAPPRNFQQPRKQLDFLPRALHRPPTSTSKESSTDSAQTSETAPSVTGPSKSNEDFRKMFF